MEDNKTFETMALALSLEQEMGHSELRDSLIEKGVSEEVLDDVTKHYRNDPRGTIMPHAADQPPHGRRPGKRTLMTGLRALARKKPNANIPAWNDMLTMSHDKVARLFEQHYPLKAIERPTGGKQGRNLTVGVEGTKFPVNSALRRRTNSKATKDKLDEKTGKPKKLEAKPAAAKPAPKKVTPKAATEKPKKLPAKPKLKTKEVKEVKPKKLPSEKFTAKEQQLGSKLKQLSGLVSQAENKWKAADAAYDNASSKENRQKLVTARDTLDKLREAQRKLLDEAPAKVKRELVKN